MRLSWCIKSLIAVCIYLIILWFVLESSLEVQQTSTPMDKTVLEILTMYQPDRLQKNEKVCPKEGKDILLLIAVISSPESEKFREAIRQTWGYFTRREKVSMAFFIGNSIEDPDIIKIEKEQDIYGDIVDVPVIDNPAVPSLKVIYTLEWMKSHCNKAKFILKTSDDMFLNIPILVEFVRKLDPSHRTIYGKVSNMWTPSRHLSDPKYVSLDEYKDNFFPDFTIGPTYLLPVNLSQELLSRSLSQVFFVADDILITGIVAQSLGIKRTHVEFFFNMKIDEDACREREAFSLTCTKPVEMYGIWARAHDYRIKCSWR